MMNSKEREVLVQRVATVLDLFPETSMSDTALIFRVASLYGGSYSMDAETALTFPSSTMIRRTAKKVQAIHHGR